MAIIRQYRYMDVSGPKIRATEMDDGNDYRKFHA
jgi:hypothetical protein